MPKYLLQIGVDVGRHPACVTSTCRKCSDRLFAWVRMQGFMARVQDVGPGSEIWAPIDTASLAEGVLLAFLDWDRLATGGGKLDHFQVIRGHA